MQRKVHEVQRSNPIRPRKDYIITDYGNLYLQTKSRYYVNRNFAFRHANFLERYTQLNKFFLFIRQNACCKDFI